MARSLDVIGEWWTLLIVREAFFGYRFFDDFQSRLDIPRNTLAARLSKLVNAGILKKHNFKSDGRKHEYLLTDKGKDLLPVIVALRQWGDKHLFENDGSPLKLIDKSDQADIQILKVKSVTGKVLAVDNLALVSTDKRKKIAFQLGKV